MARKPAQKYDVARVNDGALLGRDLDLATARKEAARLNAEARVLNPETGYPTCMHLGETATYSVRSKDGIWL